MRVCMCNRSGVNMYVSYTPLEVYSKSINIYNTVYLFGRVYIYIVNVSTVYLNSWTDNTPLYVSA